MLAVRTQFTMLTRSLVRNLGFSLILVFWCLSLNYAPALAASDGSNAAQSVNSASKSKSASSTASASVKAPKAAGSAPQPRSFYGGGYGAHDLLDRGFGGEFLPIFALIGFAIIFLPVLGT